MVFDIAFTRDQTAWVAGSDGLYRYDGYQWRRFTTTDGLPSNFIRTVFVTRAGTLWIGTDRGAGVFDGTRFDDQGTGGRLAGPNVRRIVETADGALWFCCDRWPDATSTGGLSRLGPDGLQNYGVVDGLPSSHTLGLFEQSDGRLIALTAGGPVVRSGQDWLPLGDPGYPAGDHTWAMAETPDGTLFAQGFGDTLVWQGGRWQMCGGSPYSTTSPFCVAADGVLIRVTMIGSDTLTFSRWDGAGFQRASAEVAVPGVDELVIRSAPDGAIWAVGRGTILRWEYLPGAWDWWPGLPPPRLEDGQGRIWFANPTNTVVRANDALRPVPGLGWPLVMDDAGEIWGAGATGVVHWVQDRLEVRAPETSRLDRFEGGVADVAGGAWLYGMDAAGDSLVVRVQGEHGTVYDPRALEGGRVLSLDPDPGGGAWGVLNHEPSSRYEVVRFTTNGLDRMAISGERPNLHRPAVTVGRTHVYLYGYAGLWESPREDPLTFRKVEPYGHAVFTQGSSLGDVTAFIAQEGLAGNAAILLRRGAEWVRQPVVYGQDLWLGRDGWMMVADGMEFALWQARQWHGTTYVSLPADTTITSMLRTRSGEYWLGTYHGVLRHRATTAPPETLVTGPGSLVEGTAAFADAHGRARFAPLSRSQRFSFTSRLNGGTWSGYGDWPAAGVPLAVLPPGEHVLEVRARDGMGNEDPTPARLAVVVRPAPIQDRVWFLPVLGCAGVVFTGLSAGLFAAIRRERRHAGGLEREVESRTEQLRADIRRREQAEQALRVSEEQYRRIVETAHEGIWCLDAGAGTVFVNRRLEEMLGYSARELLGHSMGEFLRPEDAVTHLDMLEGRRPDRADPVECRYRHAGGGWRWMSVSVTPQRDAQGGYAGSFAMLTDITGRKQADEALLASEERARRQRTAIAGLVLDDALATGAVTEALQRVAAVLVETLGTDRAGVWLLTDADAVLRCEAAAGAGGAAATRGTALRTADVPGYFAALRTDSRIAVAEAQTDPRTRELTAGYLGPLGIQSMLDAGIQVEGRLVGAVCVEHTGKGRRWHADEEAFVSTAATLVAQILVNARRRLAEAERERLQAQLLQALKMESVGRLAGGVAHDFNNMLQAILGHADLALMDLPPESPLRDNLEEIQRSARRSAELTRQLLAFARKQAIAPQVLDLNEVVTGMMRMLRRLVSEDLELVWTPGPDLGLVRMDRGQVDQVLANLCVNARDAISGPGRVTIATQNVTLPADDPGVGEVAPGPYVRLEVSDTGHGMNAETRSHLFEPYFTTKEVGKGTGLGLATVFGIVRQNAGGISVWSEPGQGTSFRLYFPRTEAVEPVAAAPVVPSATTGTETVLLVEDEEQILSLGRRSLAQQGYTVIAAASPETALELAASHGAPVDLLVTDVIMPGMNGRELYRRLRARFPDLRCLYMSGYTADIIAPHGVLDPRVEFLQKPFDIPTFTARVRSVLDQPVPPAD
jgi:PAS domain S-box-containing protein